MSKEALAKARDLIKLKEYAEAKTLLRQIDHPTAQKWLVELDRIAPNQTVSRSNTSSERLITGISSAVIVGTMSVMLFITFCLAIYGAFLRPTSIAEAQDVSTNPMQWEYITVDYSQNEIFGSRFEDDAEVTRYELIFIDTEPYASLFLNALTDGCTIADPSMLGFDQEAQTCIGGNFVGREYVLNILGADGWELIQVDNNSTEYSYKVDMVFKRRITID